MYGVILAGGSGTRFWPASRHHHPKQLLNIVGDKHMLQMTVDRLKAVPFIEDIYIITRKDLRNKILNQTDGIKEENIILEPSKKDTAPCIGLVSHLLYQKNPEATLGIFPADHLISGQESFNKTLNIARKAASEHKTICTIGISPNHPATQYGYIEYTKTNKAYYTIKRFTEKPDKSTATKFLDSGNYLWNAGMFFFHPQTVIDYLNEFSPTLNKKLKEVTHKLKQGEEINSLWEQIKPQQFDRTIMEKLIGKAKVVPSKFEWNDIGSWNVAHELSPKDKNNNAVIGDGIIISGKNNYLNSENHTTAIIGLNNIVVAHTKEATLIANRENLNEIKNLIKKLQSQGNKNI